METLPSLNEAQAFTAGSVSTQALLEIQSMEIATTTHREATDEELELIEMRCQQALALLNLESVFADGLLNCG